MDLNVFMRGKLIETEFGFDIVPHYTKGRCVVRVKKVVKHYKTKMPKESFCKEFNVKVHQYNKVVARYNVYNKYPLIRKDYIFEDETFIDEMEYDNIQAFGHRLEDLKTYE